MANRFQWFKNLFKRGTNSGLLWREPQSTDWFAGLESGITYQIVNPSGDWEAWLPQGERQGSNFFDTLGCTTWSTLNSCETQLAYIGQYKNFSDRFLAKESGTTKKGNYIENPQKAIEEKGIVLESDYPTDILKYPYWDWGTFYSEISTDLKQKALSIKT